MRSIVESIRFGIQGSYHRSYEAAMLLLCSFCLTIIVLAFLSIRSGLSETLARAASDEILIVFGTGADSEIISVLTVRDLTTVEGLVRQTIPEAANLSAELFVNIRIEKTGQEQAPVIGIRGVNQEAFDLRPGFAIEEGRHFEVGRREVIVGRALARQVDWLAPGASITIGEEDWVVSGIFSASGTVAESEIWGSTATLQNALHRQGIFQSLRIGLPDSAAAELVRQVLQDEIRDTALLIQTQSEYYQEQIDIMTEFVDYIAIPSIVILVSATLIAAMNSMYVMVRTRNREIAIMRAIGFPSITIVAGIFVQALMLCCIGYGVGLMAAHLLFGQIQASIMSTLSFRDVILALEVLPTNALIALVMILFFAMLGGLPSALFASQSSIINAMERN